MVNGGTEERAVVRREEAVEKQEGWTKGSRKEMCGPHLASGTDFVLTA